MPRPREITDENNANPRNVCGKHFCFTLNNYTPGEVELLQNVDCWYLVCGEEKAPTTGTIHLQCFIQFKKKKKLSTVINRLPRRSAKVQRMYERSTVEACVTYCKKDEKIIVEIGGPWFEKKINGLDELNDLIKDGKTTVDELCLNNPMAHYQYGRTLSRTETIVRRKTRRKVFKKGIWFFGLSMTGKTHRAWQYIEENKLHDDLYEWQEDNGYYTDYEPHMTCMLINEFRGGMPYNELLRITDKWPTRLKRKSIGVVPCMIDTVIVTSSLNPYEVYRNLSANDNIMQLIRRFEIYECIDQNTVVRRFEVDIETMRLKDEVPKGFFGKLG